MVHNHCPFELVFSKSPKINISFNSNDNIKPLYNKDDYAKESKFRLENSYKRALTMHHRLADHFLCPRIHLSKVAKIKI